MSQPITRAQFESVRPMLEAARKPTRPRKNDLYQVFCAVLYRMESGCSWRSLPAGAPPWRSVHQYHTIWNDPPQEGLPLLQRACEQLGIRWVPVPPARPGPKPRKAD